MIGTTHFVRVRLWSLEAKVPSDSQLKKAQRVYAQVGIELRLVERRALFLKGEELRRFDKIEGVCAREPYGEFSELQSLARGVAASEIVVFFVSDILHVSIDKVKLDGCASHHRDRPSLTLDDGSSKWTLAHELGHSLMREGTGDLAFGRHHSVPANNLMSIHVRSMRGKDLPALTSEQAGLMKRSPYCLPLTR